MARALVGLDIGTSAVRAAEIKLGAPPVLDRFAQLTVPPGSVSNGEIADADAVVAVLKELWRRGEFRSKRVAMALANQAVVVRQVEVPEMEDADLRSALPYQVQDYIPMPIEETYLDSLVLDRFVGPEGAPMMRVLAVAAQRTMVDAFIQVVQAAGLQPEVIDVSPLAVTRALTDPSLTAAEGSEAEAIVDVGGGITNLVVQERGLPRFVRILNAGGNDITAALVSELGLSPEEAEERKIATGLQPEGFDIPAGAATVIEARARAFIDDIRRSLEYYSSQPGSGRIGRVLLAGGGAQLLRFAERLASAIRIPVEHASALSRVAVGELHLDEQQLQQVGIVAAVAVGAGLEE